MDLYVSKAGEASGHPRVVVIGDYKNNLSLKELPFRRVMWSLSLEQTGEMVHFSVDDTMPGTL